MRRSLAALLLACLALAAAGSSGLPWNQGPLLKTWLDQYYFGFADPADWTALNDSFPTWTDMMDSVGSAMVDPQARDTATAALRKAERDSLLAMAAQADADTARIKADRDSVRLDGKQASGSYGAPYDSATIAAMAESSKTVRNFGSKLDTNGVAVNSKLLLGQDTAALRSLYDTVDYAVKSETAAYAANGGGLAAPGYWFQQNMATPISITSMAWDSVNSTMWAVNNNTSKVYVYSTTTGLLIDSVTTDTMPACVVVNTTSNKVYVTTAKGNWEDGGWDVWVFNGTTRAKVCSLDFVGEGGARNGPVAMTWNPNNNRVYVSCTHNSTWTGIRVIDGVGDTVMTTHAMAMTPMVPSGAPMQGYSYNNGQALSLTSNRLYIGSNDSLKMAVVDCDADTLMPYIRFRLMPSYVAWNSVEDQIYTTNGNGGTGDSLLYQIDCATNTIVDSSLLLSGQLNKMVYNAYENKLYSVHYNPKNLLCVMDCDANTVTRKATPRTLFDIVIDPRLNRLYAGGNNDTMYMTLDCRTDLWIDSTPTRYQSQALFVDRVNHRVWGPDRYHTEMDIYNGLRPTPYQTLGAEAMTTHSLSVGFHLPGSGAVMVDSFQYRNDTLYQWIGGKRGPGQVFATP
jgi:hypothetical protein